MFGLCRGYLGASWGFVANLFTKHIKTTHLIEMQTVLSLGPCGANTHQSETLHPRMFMKQIKTHTSSHTSLNATITIARPLSREHAPTLNPTPKQVHDRYNSTHLIEMRESLSLCPCRANMQLRNTTMSSDIEFTHIVEMSNSLSR